MIYLEKNTKTLICIEANELNTTGQYLFRFYQEQYKIETLVYLTPHLDTERYISFEVDLPNDVDLAKEGDYIYEVYDGVSPATDYKNMTLLEVGKLKLS